ncbi:MAG: hypothetical protein ACRDOK_04390 [Streptosporangiaceae bacterium]
MSGTPTAMRIAERLILVSCRRLPEDDRHEHYKEWSAELPAILADASVRLPILRSVRALRFSAGISLTTRYLRRTGSSARRARTGEWRDGANRVRPAAPLVRLAIGVIIWLAFVFALVSVLRAYPQPHGWPVVTGLALAGAFDAFCLADLARVGQVRYLPRWAWALICLAQTPGGGIVYLCVGRGGRVRTAPPSSAGRP